MVEFKLKTKNCNRRLLFRTGWVCSRSRYAIRPVFAYCLGSRVLYVTLTNQQEPITPINKQLDLCLIWGHYVHLVGDRSNSQFLCARWKAGRQESLQFFISYNLLWFQLLISDTFFKYSFYSLWPASIPFLLTSIEKYVYIQK